MALAPCLDISSPLITRRGGQKPLLSPQGQPRHLKDGSSKKTPLCQTRGRAGKSESCMSNYPWHTQQDPSFTVSPRLKICFLLAR